MSHNSFEVTFLGHPVRSRLGYGLALLVALVALTVIVTPYHVCMRLIGRKGAWIRDGLTGRYSCKLYSWTDLKRSMEKA